ncbi:hypothetical protein B9G69_015630 [Bdellovibrio sp. SKB1291214]|uniref:hypothetical protein n=1 Tax=Bdellovibrio sp. SKB1291214 TaxID=1732569 RepID=UPI000B51B773|nr:hypothetical protein [Bdellovibrio sp. SKB1291214]UYL08474.1 hypothetical protein B9G69_015630 [Bdellovibrio sp. SKB1291214]
MTKLKTIQFAMVSIATVFSSTMVLAASGADYTEVSYDDLVNELSQKKSTYEQTVKDANGPQSHIGIGYVNGFTNISTGGESFNRHTSGIQLSAGRDLSSRNIYGEVIFRNYGSNDGANEEFSLRELEAKVGYTNQIEGVWNYSVSSGLSARMLKYSNPSKDMSVDETNPSLVIASGIFAQVHRNISVGIEGSARTAMVNKPSDKDSFDFAFRLNTSL